MSVYTPLTLEDAQAIAADFPIEQIQSLTPIAEGTSNSNFFLNTSYVLTVSELIGAQALESILTYTCYLADHGIPCPKPLVDNNGNMQTTWQDKPVIIVPKLPGRPVLQPTADHCTKIGSLLGRMHRLGTEYPNNVPPQRAKAWRKSMVEKLSPKVSNKQRALLDELLAIDQELPWSELPKGVIHADLFRDNVLFEQDKLCGVFDFYLASFDALLYDVAITINDWCTQKDGTLDKNRYQNFLSAYNAHRDFTPAEHVHWDQVCAIAGLRFWLSRLDAVHFPPPGDLVHQHDPNAFECIIRAHLARFNQVNSQG